MKFARFSEFDSFIEAITPSEQIICVRLRSLILDNFPDLKEKFAYGAPFYHRNARVCFLYPASLPYSGISTGVSFGFNKGYLLSNEQGLLDMGTRKEVAYIALQHEKDINEAAFLEILHEAVLIDSEMSSGKKKKR
ncbi:MAG: DUF1801 domain-containing protein [Saprospiraceae bacterium]|nr:DUF1801 domain-containing protein [Saprospiraceae bacterium]MCB9342965.1 DUF1801 domain-containing protein [Lewinellaceae bacterium]